jgi:hypothetical protein
MYIVQYVVLNGDKAIAWAYVKNFDSKMRNKMNLQNINAENFASEQ